MYVAQQMLIHHPSESCILLILLLTFSLPVTALPFFTMRLVLLLGLAAFATLARTFAIQQGKGGNLMFAITPDTTESMDVGTDVDGQNGLVLSEGQRIYSRPSFIFQNLSIFQHPLTAFTRR